MAMKAVTRCCGGAPQEDKQGGGVAQPAKLHCSCETWLGEALPRPWHTLEWLCLTTPSQHAAQPVMNTFSRHSTQLALPIPYPVLWTMQLGHQIAEKFIFAHANLLVLA